jgi:hypothetical protein
VQGGILSETRAAQGENNQDRDQAEKPPATDADHPEAASNRTHDEGECKPDTCRVALSLLLCDQSVDAGVDVVHQLVSALALGRQLTPERNVALQVGSEILPGRTVGQQRHSRAESAEYSNGDLTK